MARLSIVVPVFNVGVLVERCLDSLINQSYRDIDIIIVDDGSTDNTYDYIAPYLIRDNRLCYVKQIHAGLGNARNAGIIRSTSEFITFVDSDDWVDLDMYQTMIDSLDKSAADIAVCGIKTEFDNYVDRLNPRCVILTQRGFYWRFSVKRKSSDKIARFTGLSDLT